MNIGYKEDRVGAIEMKLNVSSENILQHRFWKHENVLCNYKAK